MPEADRGTFSGLAHSDVPSYLRSLGITSAELLPIHAFVDDSYLVEKGLRNYWGYNSSPSSRRSRVTSRRPSQPNSRPWSNEANGEDNRDGHSNNHSWNCGAEGPTDDPEITGLRER